jgi:negative elongation factor C/D
MEPDILSRLRDYVSAQGNPQAAVEFLTDGYVGYAAAASLVCGWLDLLDKSGGGEDDKINQEKKKQKQQSSEHQPNRSTTTPNNNNNNKIKDEAYYLRKLAKERFDPGKFAGVFQAGGSGAPKWINGLIADPQGRQLIYHLAARHPDSLLLNFAIQKILRQPGREGEVAAVGSSLSGIFAVFHQMISAKIKAIAAATTKEQIQQLSVELAQSCCNSQHTYVYTQLLLYGLADHPQLGGRFLRVARDLEAAAAESVGAVVWKIASWFGDVGGATSGSNIREDFLGKEEVIEVEVVDVRAQAAGYVAELLLSGGTGSSIANQAFSLPPSAVIIKLYKLYDTSTRSSCSSSSSSFSSNHPPLRLIRHPRMLELLLQCLFTSERTLPGEGVSACAGILSIAAACGGSTSNGNPVEDEAVVATKAGIETAIALSKKTAANDEVLSTDEVHQLETIVSRYPCCALGILGLLQRQLSSVDYWQSASHRQLVAVGGTGGGGPPPATLTLLRSLIHTQPIMHPKLLTLIHKTLTAIHTSNVATSDALSKYLLDEAVELAKQGRPLQVLHWMEAWAATPTVDSSLSRYFIYKLLQTAAPPYTQEFVGAVLRLMGVAGVKRKRIGFREAGFLAVLEEFVNEGCKGRKWPVGSKEYRVWRELMEGIDE